MAIKSEKIKKAVFSRTDIPKNLGKLLVVDYYGCDKKRIDKISKIKKALKKAAHDAKLRILKTYFHQFDPVGLSGVVVIAESHIAIHSWPEHAFVSVDIFTCGKKADPRAAHRSLTQYLKPKKVRVSELKRGR